MGKVATQKRFARWKPEWVSKMGHPLNWDMVLTFHKRHCRSSWRLEGSSLFRVARTHRSCRSPLTQA